MVAGVPSTLHKHYYMLELYYSGYYCIRETLALYFLVKGSSLRDLLHVLSHFKITQRMDTHADILNYKQSPLKDSLLCASDTRHLD